MTASAAADEAGEMRRQKIDAQQHADGNEEDAVERIAERQDVGNGLVTVLRFRNHQAGDECAERQ